jgi:flagellar M-ring protein FliF
MSMGKTAGMALVIAVLVLLAWRASRRSRRSDLSAGETAALDRIQAVLEQRQNSALGDGSGGPAALESSDAGPSAEALALEGRHREITALVEQQPDEVAQLLRGWLAERRA